MRLLAVFFVLAILFLIPFVLWGDVFEDTFSPEGAVSWLRGFGNWAWAAGVALLLGDLLLPVPATAVMSALGFVYGPIAGGLIGGAGSFLSGTFAYGLCRALGRGAAVWLAGEKDLQRGESLFASAGGWAVAFSRWLPLLPEIIACMAGLARMPLRSFLVSLACGCLPMAFTFATVGHVGVESPVLCLTLSALIPLLLWPVAQWLLRGNSRGRPGKS